MAINVRLSPEDEKRIDRLRNRKGRLHPSKVPARLTRTSAFAPKRRNLITDSDFVRLYVVPGHSVVRVSGRELGSQHRDALYALFRLPREAISMSDPSEPIGRLSLFQTRTTWRELLLALGLTEHANNVANLVICFEEIMKVTMTVFEGEQEHVLRALKEGKLPHSPFAGKHLLHEFEAEGAKLDDRVTVTYGKWATDSMARLRLVSLNADVQFRLQSDYAKSFWPYIDSMTKHRWVDEDMLAALIGRDLWAEGETAQARAHFRALCRKAFDDMVDAGGLTEWSEEVRGKGRTKSRRYHYVPADLGKQGALDLGDVEGSVGEPIEGAIVLEAAE